jgi:uncharacterized membrane protein
MKKYSLIINLILPMFLFSQEIVQYEEINNENKKYAVLYYNMKIYKDIDYITEFIKNLKEIDPWDRFELIEICRIYENNDVIYYFSGDCVFSSEGVGDVICRIKLTDNISGDSLTDELITDIYDGKYFRDDFSVDQEIIETGNDSNGLYENRKKWEIGKSDYLLNIFKNTLYSLKNKLLNLEYIDELNRIYP